MLVATWNVNSLKARMPRVEEWLADVSPDIVCLQETKMSDDNFPALAFASMGYEAVHNGQGQWNGVAILSKVGLAKPTYGFAPGIEPDPDSRLISATCGSIRVHSVYVPNGRALDHDHYRYKLSWFERLVDHLSETTDPGEEIIVAGDWNVAPTDIDVWDMTAFEGGTHVSDAERAAIKKVLDWGLVDTFRVRYPEQPKLYSYFDYQAGRFHKRQGVRIDFVLSSQSVAKTSTLDVFDRNARKGTKPSDHVPVLAGFS